MKLEVVSSKKKVSGEVAAVVDLFEKGLQTFHVRKNHYSKKKLRKYLRQIPKEYHSRIILHSHQSLALWFKVKGVLFSTRQVEKGGYYLRTKLMLKIFRRKTLICRGYDNLSDLLAEKKRYDFVVLNPVLDSISEDPTATAFSQRAIESCIENSVLKVHALGGVKSTNLSMLYKMGFKGAILNAQIWDDRENRIANFVEAKLVLERIVDPENIKLRKVAG